MSEFDHTGKENAPEPTKEQFIEETLRSHAEHAISVIAPVFLGDSAELFEESFEIDIDEKHNIDNNCVPTARYDARSGKGYILIAPNPILSYAEDVAIEADGEIGSADVVKILVGAGVARTILGFKTAIANLDGEEQTSRYMEVLCSKAQLWEDVANFDDDNNAVAIQAAEDTGKEIELIDTLQLRKAVERLGDDQIPRVNLLRFAIGVSLRYMSDSEALQHTFVELHRAALLDAEHIRKTDLRLNLGWLEPGSAFTIYDDEFPETEFALSFPMTPAEEQAFIDS